MQLTFQDTRFDPDLTPMHDLAKAMASAFGYTAELRVDPELAQLLRLRVAQINQCAYCLILHTRAARDRGIDAARIDGLAAWQACGDLYSGMERAALKYCEALTDGRPQGFEDAHQALLALCDEQTVAEIAAIVINMNLWTRLKLAQGAVPVPGQGDGNP